MHGNIIEIGTDNKKLSVFAGFLRISEENQILKDIPLDLILSIIVTSPTVVYTQPLLQKLAEEGIPMITCGKNYIPIGIFLPLVGHYKQTYIQRLQFNTKLTRQKKLWQEIVIEKVKKQAAVLKLYRKKDSISPLISHITSGDSQNIEAMAAKQYFLALFGQNFKRDREAEGINSFLNYGYAVVRACIARFTVAVGLCPTLAIKHQNQLNPLCLVDDLIEPFRPLVDAMVYKIFKENQLDEKALLTPIYKKRLAGILEMDLETKSAVSPTYLVIEEFVRRYVAALSDPKIELVANYKFPHV